ncbi:MAG: acyl-CoA thioesterase [Candidatus Methylomirabilis sp.]|nr:acyl-CoA thioesterase [Deltaproteobacteria bacterium]
MTLALAHETLYRVPFCDTDAIGIVYYANYLKYFEIGRAELFRAIGHPFPAYIARGQYLIVVDAYAKYHRPARYDEVLAVRAGFDKVGRATLRIVYEVARKEDGERLAEGFTSHAVVDDAGRPSRLPEDLVATIRARRGG